MSSSLICRVRGLGSFQNKVLRRRERISGGFFAYSSSLARDLRSVNDREEWREVFESCDRILEGVLRVFGISSSSIVLPRARVGGGVVTRLRTEMPCRCRSFRFYSPVSIQSQLQFHGSYPWEEPWPLSAGCFLPRVRIHNGADPGGGVVIRYCISNASES
jgi:hypothetical protein